MSMIAIKILKIATRQGMKAKDIAKAAGVSKDAAHKWLVWLNDPNAEDGRIPSREKIEKLADEMGYEWALIPKED